MKAGLLAGVGLGASLLAPMASAAELGLGLSQLEYLSATVSRSTLAVEASFPAELPLEGLAWTAGARLEPRAENH